MNKQVRRVLKQLNNYLLEISEMLVELALRLLAVVFMISAGIPLIGVLYDLVEFTNSNPHYFIMNNWLDPIKFITLGILAWYLGKGLTNVLNKKHSTIV